MAISNFRVVYKNGECSIKADEVLYHDDETNNNGGVIAPQEEILRLGDQNVLCQINSSQEILTALKSDPRAKWLLDVSGWEVPVVEPPKRNRPKAAKKAD